MENPAYQTVYNVGLLDDIHNYFPALLYDHGNFQTLPSIFSYIRHQMNNRFNLYSYGASLASARAPISVDAPTRGPTAEEDALSSIASVNFLLSLIQPGFAPASRIPTRIRTQGGEADIWAAFRSPVIVAPSVEIISANTSIILGSDTPSNTVCSICQDAIIATDSCRRLTVCQHVYHRVCIDQWFSRSVFCPSCRHDIRATSPRLQAATATATAAPMPPMPPMPPTESTESASSSPVSPYQDQTIFQALGYR